MNKKYAELDFPAWFDGKDVNEAAFCREFLSKNKLIYADNAFFTPDGRLTGPLLLKEKIYAELECCATKNIPRTISNIVEIMKLAAHAESFPPKPDEIHVQNGTLRIDGSFLAGRPEIVRSRFPVAYNPQAEKPVVWLRFLSDLLYPEDIPTFQEYIGYCLVPSTKGQRMMILKGEGGEGKSQIGPVLARLFGCNMKDGSIAKISDNRFARADLEHIHLLVDAIYGIWCDENGLTPIRQRSFSDFLMRNLKTYNLEHTNTVTNATERRVWGYLGIEPLISPRISENWGKSLCTYVPES